MLERIVYTVVVVCGVAAAYALAERFGMFDRCEVVSQNREEGDKND
jgi:hypothetical protein